MYRAELCTAMSHCHCSVEDEQQRTKAGKKLFTEEVHVNLKFCQSYLKLPRKGNASKRSSTFSRLHYRAGQ